MRPEEPRPSKAIESQLAAFRKGKELAESFETDDFASQLAMESMLAYEEALLDEFHAAEMLESTDDVVISLSGMPVYNHTVAADFLGILLSGLQDLIKLISFGVKHSSSIGDKISEKVLKESKIMVTGWAASSFTVKMRLPEIEGIGEAFAEDRRDKVLHCLEELFRDDAPDRELTDLVTKYAAKKAYRKILGNVVDKKGEVQLRTKARPYGVKLTPKGARKRISWMNEPEEESREFELAGELVGGSLESKQFELKVGESVYYGRVLPEAHEQMKGFKYGELVRALIKEVKKYRKRAQAEPTISHYLESVFKIPET